MNLEMSKKNLSLRQLLDERSVLVHEPLRHLPNRPRLTLSRSMWDFLQFRNGGPYSLDNEPASANHPVQLCEVGVQESFQRPPDALTVCSEHLRLPMPTVAVRLFRRLPNGRIRHLKQPEGVGMLTQART